MRPNHNNNNRQYQESLLRAFFNRSDLPMSLLIALRKIISYYNPSFYAADLNLASGTLCGLRSAGLIKPTGQVKVEYVLVDEYEELYRKVKINEWELAIDPSLVAEAYANFIRSISL